MADVARLLMTGDTLGGVWSYAIELSRALAPANVAVTLATMGAPATGAQRRKARSIRNLDLIESHFRLEWMADPWPDVTRAGDWLLDLAARVRPDVVHLNNYCHGALPWPAPVVMVGHADVLSWFRAVRGRTAPPAWDRYAREVARGLRAADVVVAPTRAMLESLVADYGQLANTRVIASARDSARFAPGRKRACILAAGRLWDDAKNLRALDDAAAHLSWPVEIAGAIAHPDGGRHPSRHARALGLQNSDELAAHFSEAAIYALPARYEPFGFSILEAALSGCALVLGDIASLRESWHDAARFVAPDDVDALTATLDELSRNAAERARLAARARRRALSFSPARMAAAYLDAYNSAGQRGLACA